MTSDNEKIDQVINKLENALKTVAQGRVYDVGTKITYRGKFGVVVDLNKDSTHPTGSTIDIRLEDGEIIENVNVSSPQLKRYRA